MPGCKLCQEEVKNYKSLTNHLRAHKITSQDYYDNFLKNPDEGLCIPHQKPTKYIDITHGYKLNCSRSCGCSVRAKQNRANLKKDPEKYKVFREKVSKNQIKIWDERVISGEKTSILENVHKKVKTTISKWSKKKRKEKFGWLNNLTGEERLEAIDKITKPLRNFWNSATQETAVKVYKKREATKINKGATNTIMGYKTYTGKYIPKFPEKYKGDITTIHFRSSWERKVFKSLDLNPNVIAWMSEEIVVPYISPKDSKPHRYFPDLLVKVNTKDGKIKVWLIEIKPFNQTQPPKSPKTKRGQKRYLEESITYAVNQAKWKSALRFCKQKGWEFKVLTEKEIFGK